MHQPTAVTLLLLLASTHAKESSIMRHENPVPSLTELKNSNSSNSSGQVLPVIETDPTTHVKDINHHFVLVQPSEDTVVSGVLVIEKGFSTLELKTLCADEMLDCILDTWMAVIRTPEDAVKSILEKRNMQDVKYATVRDPAVRGQIVKYLKTHLRLKDVGKALANFSKAGVLIPAELIAREFREEGIELSLLQEQDMYDSDLETHGGMTSDDEGEDDEETSALMADDEDGEQDDEVDSDSATNMYRHFLLHQVDASSPVDGVLAMKDGQAFNMNAVKKVCRTFKDELQCLEDLPISVVRTPTESMTKILAQLPSVKFVSLQDNVPQIVNFLKEHIGEESVPEFFAAYAHSGVRIPEEVSKEFNDDHMETSHLLEMDEEDILEAE